MEQKTNDEFMRNILVEEAWKDLSLGFAWSEPLLDLGRYFAKPLHSMDDPYGWQVLQAHQLEDFLGVCRREGFDAKVCRGVQGQVGLA